MATDPIARMLASDSLRLDAEERFWPKVMRPMGWEACWPWQAASKSKGGYGNFKLASYTQIAAHRISYALHHGQSPGELHVLHKCDNPSCVNPLHLFLGTNADNVADKVAKGRALGRDMRGARNGNARLSDEQVTTIRQRIAKGENNTRIAADYGVTHQLISRIRRGRSWGGRALCAPYQRAAIAVPPIDIGAAGEFRTPDLSLTKDAGLSE
jgi:hypothetical protein